MKKIILTLLLLIVTTACISGNKTKTQEEIYADMEKEISEMKYFKYTSRDSAYLAFYEGQTENTFSVDKKGNGYSNKNGEQLYKADGTMYMRMIGLRQEGTSAEVIMDSLSEYNRDIGYFDRNTENVREFLRTNLKAFSRLQNQKISSSGKGIKIEITDLKDTDFSPLDSIEIYYIPGYGIDYSFLRTENFEGKQKKYTVTDKLVFNQKEIIKLPELMDIGTKLKLK